MLQLAHITRPAVCSQARRQTGIDRADIDCVPGGVAVTEMFEQNRDVLGAVAQRRDRDRCDGEAVVQVFAEPAALGFLQKVFLGRGDHPHIDRNRDVGADPLDRALLQYPQQPDLGVQRHRLDLVQEHRSTLGKLKPADPTTLGTGESPRFVPEQLAPDQSLRQRPAIDGNERAGSPVAGLVQSARHQFLAGPGLPGDQDIDPARTDRADQAAQSFDPGRRADDRRRGIRGRAGRALQGPQLLDQPPLLQRVRDRENQLRRIERLLQEIVCARAHRLHREGNIAVAGHQDHRQIPVGRLHGPQQRDAVKARHPDIGHDDAVGVGAEPLDHGVGAFARLDAQSRQFERLGAGVQHVGVVVDQDHRAGLDHSAASAWLACRVNRNTAPPRGASPTVSVPPMSRMIEYAIDRPRPSPAPGSLVVYIGSKIRSRLSAGTPGPLSATEISTTSPVSTASSTIQRSLPPATASRALVSRFTNTCSRRTGSARTDMPEMPEPTRIDTDASRA
ncbi:hypothetical protein BAL199_08998 [alpha proteobacterium BAL199]|nr:hypothetical protein BAL199_08998 [alpha proteobacterium BAL199]